MRRREFIAGLGGAAAWPLVARGQQRKLAMIGLLNGASFEGPYAVSVAAIRHGLLEVGFVEGQNLTIEYRTANGRADRLPELAADLVRRQVAVIIAIGAATPAQAAKAVTATIPIVFANGSDAVELGLVKSLSRPEANVTGMSFATRQLAPKRLELLCEMVPGADVVGYLDNSRLSPAAESSFQGLAAAARALGRKVITFDASTDAEIVAAFAGMTEQRVRALVISTDAFLFSRRELIIAFAARQGLPTIHVTRDEVALGGLMSYNAIIDDMYRQAGVYAGRILKGEKPADLPVVRPTKFELAINLKTAKALGLTIPPNLLAIADEVIE
jgi:putative tryptophan/tyrosine transport system substrate-binding protein